MPMITYIVIPARNAQFTQVEIDHFTQWAQVNNLLLNRAKSIEIIFEDCGHKSQAQYGPPELPDIHHVMQIKILGVTVTNYLSIMEHVRDVICKCGQSVCAIKVLRSHGVCVHALKDI